MARPREFDIDEALNAATGAFWEHGYEGTSLADLMKAMKLQKGSVYKAFGSKHELFMQVLERYLDELYRNMQRVLSQAESPSEAIRQVIKITRSVGIDGDVRKGCLAVNSVVEMAPHDTQVQQAFETHHKRVMRALTKVIENGQADGSFRKDVPARELAAYLTMVSVGFVSSSKAGIGSLDSPKFEDLLFSSLAV